MVRTSPLKNDFSTGEFAPVAESRVDFQRYPGGARILENFLPIVVGAAVRRPGTTFIASTRYPAKVATLLPFQYSTEQAYVLEFGDLYVRFYRNDGPLLEATKTISGATAANPVVLTINAHGYSNGDDIEVSGIVGMTQLNGRRFRVANKAANTVELTDMHGTNIDGTAYTAYSSGGSANRVYTLTTTYQEQDLTGLKYAQKADVFYIAHTEYVPRKLERYGATNWVLSQIDFQDGPYLPLNASQATLAKSATTGAGVTISCSLSQVATGMANNGSGAIRVTLAAHGWKTGDKIDITGTTGTTESIGTWTLIRVSASTFDLAGSTFVNAWVAGGTIKPHIFESTDVGRLIRILDSSTWGYAKIVGYTSAVSVTADVINAFGATTAVSTWRLGLYSEGGGYPSCVTFYEGRLFWGGCPLQPTRVDGSVSSSYENFAPTTTAAVVGDDNAVSYTLDSGDVNNVLWMKDDEKGLLVGTKGGEWIVRANQTNAALTPTNVRATRSTTYGSYENSQPVRTGKDILMVQRKRQKLRNLAYTYEIDGFDAGDLTLLSAHIGQKLFGQIAFQSEPEGWVWCVRADGQMPTLMYERGESKIGWGRQIFGGYYDAAKTRHAVAESAAVVPSPTDSRDEVWVIINRSINGQTERYVELLTAPWEVGDDQQKAFYVDSGLIFDGATAATQTLTPGAGATVKGTTGVTFTAGGSVFVVGDVGRQITMRYFDYTETDPESPEQVGMWKTAKAEITGYTSGTVVTCTIFSPWPDLTAMASGGWRLSASSLSNLWHLEGQTIKVNAEGATHPDVIVTNGRATLTRPVAYAVAGLAYQSRLWTLRIEGGSQDGTSQAKKKRFNEVTVRVVQSLGGEIGPNFDDMSPMDYRNSATPLGSAPSIGDGDHKISPWSKGWETEGRIAIRQSAPFPLTIAAIMPQLTTSDKG